MAPNIDCGGQRRLPRGGNARAKLTGKSRSIRQNGVVVVVGRVGYSISTVKKSGVMT